MILKDKVVIITGAGPGMGRRRDVAGDECRGERTGRGGRRAPIIP